MFLEIASYVARVPFDCFFSKFVVSYLISLGIWAGNFHKVLMKLFREVCQKCILRVRRKVLKKYTSFEETPYVYSFSKTLSEIFGNFYKKLGRFWIIYPICPETVSGEKLISFFFISHFVFWAKLSGLLRKLY